MTQAGRSKSAIVVGAGSGIGRALALGYAARGYEVAALCRRPDAFDAGQSAARIDVRRCDVTDLDQIREALSEVPSGAVVVHTAAANAPVAPIWECPEPAGLGAVATMITSAWLITRLCLAHMVAAGSGLVLLASSGAANKIAAARATYSMCKAAIDQLVRVVGAELEMAGSPVGLAAFYPGMVDTGMQRASRAEAEQLRGGQFAPALGLFGEAAAAGQLISAESVAAALVELSGRDPRSLNGRIWRLRSGEWSAL
jgi:NAD(P)-dependent dehydrogenase (short-subunit alcohol dehydrogenase family)